MLCSASLSSLRSAGFQPAWRPGWPPSQAGSPPHPLPGRLVPAIVFPDERAMAGLQPSVNRSREALPGSLSQAVSSEPVCVEARSPWPILYLQCGRLSHRLRHAAPTPHSESRDIRNACTCQISSCESSCSKAGILVPWCPLATVSKNCPGRRAVLKTFEPTPPPVR